MGTFTLQNVAVIRGTIAKSVELQKLDVYIKREDRDRVKL